MNEKAFITGVENAKKCVEKQGASRGFYAHFEAIYARIAFLSLLHCVSIEVEFSEEFDTISS